MPAISDALIDEGAHSVDVTDAQAGTQQETPIFGEPGEENDAVFGLNRVVALFSSERDARAGFENAARATGFSCLPEMRIAEVQEQDWVRHTQSQFDPIQISDRLWIVPSWHVAPDPAAINVVLDPGLAFGTGSHPTTRLCLAWLEGHSLAGQSVIDYGCGSGILAIAAAKLGAGPVTGIDIDEQAVQSSRYNAQRNNVSAEFYDAGSSLPEPADIVIANILANPLKVLAPLLAELTRSHGSLVLSGILAPQAIEVSDVYQHWFDMQAPAEQDGWVRLSGVRKA